MKMDIYAKAGHDINGVKFNRLQWDVVLHRLSAVDCFYDVFGAEYGSGQMTTAEVDAAVESIHGGVVADENAALILEDCIDGSTYLADADDHLEPLALSRLLRTFEAAATRVEKIVGREVGRPPEA